MVSNCSSSSSTTTTSSGGGSSNSSSSGGSSIISRARNFRCKILIKKVQKRCFNFTKKGAFKKSCKCHVYKQKSYKQYQNQLHKITKDTTFTHIVMY